MIIHVHILFFSGYSACSEFFRDAFKRMQPPRSGVMPMSMYLHGVSLLELQSILEFMYQVGNSIEKSLIEKRTVTNTRNNNLRVTSESYRFPIEAFFTKSDV